MLLEAEVAVAAVAAAAPVVAPNAQRWRTPPLLDTCASGAAGQGTMSTSARRTCATSATARATSPTDALVPVPMPVPMPVPVMALAL